MNQTELDQISQRLLLESAAIDRQLAEYGVESGAIDVGLGEGFADSAHATAERSQALSMVDQLQTARAQVERALERIQEGSYTRCESCGDEIPLERLQAIPTTTLCIACKQR